MKQAFVSWSGGKDGCLACHRAVRLGLDVRCLLNMVSEDGQRSRSHGLDGRWVALQAEAMGVPIVQQRTADSDYEVEFKNALTGFRQIGITEGVFGDIDFEEHRKWNQGVCAAAGIEMHLPLWQEDQSKLLDEFISAGFEAVVVTTRGDLLGKEWLGRKLDRGFVADLAREKGVTPCGEAGEYHTLVIDGPLFKRKIRIVEASPVLKDGYCLLDIKRAELVPNAPGY
jgi:diphthine-ammonia ligase